MRSVLSFLTKIEAQPKLSWPVNKVRVCAFVGLYRYYCIQCGGFDRSSFLP